MFLSFPSLGCQLQASYLQHHLKGGHFIQVEWYDYHLDPARAAGVVDLRFNKPARQAFETWSETLLSAPATSATGEIFRPGGRLVFQDFDGNITEVFLPNDNINKLCKIKDLYFTQDQKLLEKAMVYLTLPASSPAGKP